MKIIKCMVCGLNNWTEFIRFFNFDANHENITYECTNCGYMHTVKADLTIKKKVVQ